MSCIKEVRAVYDVESDLHYIDVLYTKYVENDGMGMYEDFREYLQCRPIGSWTEIKSVNQSLRYDRFLDAMVQPSIEVRRKQCDLLLDEILVDYDDASTPRERVRLARSTRILEPSFNLHFDPNSPWQNEIAKRAAHALRDLVDACTDERKLTRMFSVLRDILEAR